MGGNFDFLKKINSNLYSLVNEAEQLYRDEYFEQCMVQTRRFGEQVCKDILVQNNKPTGSFDDMLATLKDNSHGSVEEKEFIDDLYFLKKNGNQSAHSGKVKKDAMTALECLKRAFEISINYSVYNQEAPTSILRAQYDIDLLVTGKTQKKSLKDKYIEAKQQGKENLKNSKNRKEKVEKPKIKFNIQFSLFWKTIFILSFLSFCLILTLVVWHNILKIFS